MSYKQLVIILSGANGKRSAVKICGDLDGVKDVKLTVKDASNYGGGALYVFGEKISKTALKSNETEYKVQITAKSDVTCVLTKGDEIMLGGSGKTPPLRSLLSQIDGFEKEQKKQKETDKNQQPSTPNEAPVSSPNEAPVLTYEKRPTESSNEHSQRIASDEVSSATSDDESSKPKRPIEDRPSCDNPSGGSPASENQLGAKPIVEKTAVDRIAAENSAYENLAPVSSAPENYSAGQALGGMAKPTRTADVLDKGVRYNGTNFYLAIKPQLDELFICYPEDKTLNEIVPNSKWVRVDAEDGYYVVGILYDLSAPSFICYGIPSVFQKQPPSEIADVCVWLPLNLDKRDDDGYWVIYQSAIDGKCIR